jgi:hypothetical protein
LTGRLVVDELRCEGGEVGEVLEGVTMRGLGEEEVEGGGFWGFLSRRKVNLPSRELIEDMCGERPQAEEGGRREKGKSDERERRKERGSRRGVGWRAGWSGRTRLSRNTRKGKMCGACQQSTGKKKV